MGVNIVLRCDCGYIFTDSELEKIANFHRNTTRFPRRKTKCTKCGKTADTTLPSENYLCPTCRVLNHKETKEKELKYL